jgi:hypothetical protein
MENKKIKQFLIENTIFFIVFNLIRYFFIDFRTLKICLYLLIILFVSYRNLAYISSVKINKIRHYTFFVILLCLMFEISKKISYIIGILRRYDDVPFLIGLSVSSVAILLYFLLLLIISKLIYK